MKSKKIYTVTLMQLVFLLTSLSLPAQWTVAHLSEARERPYPVVAGSKILFVLGSPSETGEGNKVDIYDTQTGLWSVHNLPFASESPNPNPAVVSKDGWVFIVNESATADTVQAYNSNNSNWSTISLSEPRRYVSIGLAGEYIVFAGGVTPDNKASSKVDMFHMPTQTWHESTLSQGRIFIAITGLGKQIFMAGGFDELGLCDQVDILNTDTWVNRTSTLIEKRGLIEAVAVGNKVLLAGGGEFDFVLYNKVDIYDGDTDTWSADSLTQSDLSGIMQSAVVGKKVYFHGGFGLNVLDVYDAETDNWSTVNIPTQHSLGGFASAGNKLYLAGGVNDPSGVVEEFDCASEQWDTLGYLSSPRHWVSGITSGNKLFFAGGYGDDYSDVVDIYTGLSNSGEPPKHLSFNAIFPNPAHDWVHVELPEGATSLCLFNLEGQLLLTVPVEQLAGQRLEVAGIAPGLYLLAVRGNGAVYWGKILVE